MKRTVTLLHQFGSSKEGLTGELHSRKPGDKAAKVHVYWGHGEWIYFSALSGRESGRPRGQWRLSDGDVEAFCEQLGLKPERKPLKPLKRQSGRKRPISDGDNRQLSLVTR